MENNTITDVEQNPDLVPVLPLRDVVVYPNMVIPLFVGRGKSIEALESAMKDSKQILLVAQKEATVDEPGFADLYQVGTLAIILQLLKLPDGTIKILVEGKQRCKIEHYQEVNGYFCAIVSNIEEYVNLSEDELDVLQRTITSSFEQYVKLNNKIPPEVLNSLTSIDDASRFADTIAAHMTLKLDEKQKMLELGDVAQRLENLMILMEGKKTCWKWKNAFARALNSKWKKIKKSII